MILADTSVWVDHLRKADPRMTAHLNAAEVAIHPFVIGEIALGHLRQRATFLEDLANLPRVDAATDDEVMAFVQRHELFGRGIGWVDAHLLAAAKLTAGCRLWTRDRGLASTAASLDLAAAE